MPPYRKPFDDETPFPFACNYRDTKHPLTELPDHLHDRYEIVYVHRGRGSFFIDRTLYDKGEGDLFLIPSNTIHRSFSDELEPINSTALFFGGSFVRDDALGDSFSYLRCFEHARRTKSYRLRLAPDERRQTEELIERMHAELESGRPGSRQAVQLSLHQLLLELSRKVATAGGDGGLGPVWMRAMLHYIDEHVDADLTLRALARRAAVAPAHFSRVFKRLTGMNVTEYVAIKRIVRAKELLLASDVNLDVVAGRCGFDSLTHFHRMFKRITGRTPASYRRQRDTAGSPG